MKRIEIWLLSSILLIGAISSAFFIEGKTLMQKTTVWEEKEDGVFAYFVYGLSVTSKGTILAFAEARITSGADDGAHHIVMKRSTDQGLSFSKSKVILESKKGQSWANPTVVQDQKTKEIFIFYALNKENKSSEVYYQTSKDDGQSWSEAKEVTSLFKNNRHGWTFHVPGPGHGIQLKNGRLIVPVWHRKAIDFPTSQRLYGVNCIYSDDHGKTWKIGADTPVGELNESQIIAQKNGDILLIGRTINSKMGVYQAKVYSRNGGESWSEKLEYDPFLSGRPCDIGLTNYPKKSGTYLLSQPANQKQRKELTIRMSDDDGKTWPINKILEREGSTYSDLAVLPDHTVICLYGNGGVAHMPKKVTLARFDIKWLMDGTP